MDKKKILFYVGLLLLPLACGVSEGDFIAGASADPCEEDVSICNTKAGCFMGDTKYLEGDFPGSRNFVVSTPTDSTIIVRMFFKSLVHPGDETEIIWWEPGCNDSYVYNSMGDDIFASAGSDRVFSQEKKVRVEGPHLIDIYSDARTHYFLRVDIITPD